MTGTFLDRVVRRIFAFEGQGKVSQYEGGFTDYQAAFTARYPDGLPGEDTVTEKKADTREKKGREKSKGERKLRFSYKEQREWETIEDDIAALEASIETLDGKIEEAASDYGRLNQLMEEKAQKEELLEEKMERWMYLNDLAEQIENQ